MKRSIMVPQFPRALLQQRTRQQGGGELSER